MKTTTGKRTSSRWFELRPRSAGMLAFILRRITGIGLVAYLYLHLAVLHRLRSGPQAWDSFISLVRSPLFLALDGLLLFGLIFHALDGLRMTMVGLGRSLSVQKALFWAILLLAALLAVLGILRIPEA
jgi:succinate dehydrogenase / fumarate reductase cytochrome b subunit